MDQAETLRRLMSREGSTEDPSRKIRSIKFVATDSGVGRSVLIRNLAALLDERGVRTAVTCGTLLPEADVRFVNLVLSKAEIDSSFATNDVWVLVTTPESIKTHPAKYDDFALNCVNAGITEVGVIVNRVTDTRDARQAFGFLTVFSESVDCRLGFYYLGHCVSDARLNQAGQIGESLVELNARAVSIPFLELILKRFATWDSFSARNEKVAERLLRWR